METENRYKIVKIQEDLRTDKKIAAAFGTFSVVYAGIAALLLHVGIDKINDSSYFTGIISTIFGTSFGVADIYVIRLLKEAIEDYINTKEELENLMR